MWFLNLLKRLLEPPTLIEVRAVPHEEAQAQPGKQPKPTLGYLRRVGSHPDSVTTHALYSLQPLGLESTWLNNQGLVVGFNEESLVQFLNGVWEPVPGFVAHTNLIQRCERLNNAGQILINAQVRDGSEDCAWSAPGWCYVLHDGQTRQVANEFGMDLNDEGEVLFRTGDGSSTKTYIWKDGETRQVGPVGFFGRFLNDLGDVAGTMFCEDGSDYEAAVLESEFVRVGTGIGINPEIFGLNRNGEMILTESRPDDKKLETFWAQDANSVYVEPYGNFRGKPCSWPGGDSHLVGWFGIWTRDAFKERLGGEVLTMYCAHVNNAGWTWGTYERPEGIPYAWVEESFLVDPAGNDCYFVYGYELEGKTFLMPYGMKSYKAVNDLGQILASDGEQSFLLTPVSREASETGS